MKQTKLINRLVFFDPKNVDKILSEGVKFDTKSSREREDIDDIKSKLQRLDNEIEKVDQVKGKLLAKISKRFIEYAKILSQIDKSKLEDWQLGLFDETQLILEQLEKDIAEYKGGNKNIEFNAEVRKVNYDLIYAGNNRQPTQGTQHYLKALEKIPDGSLTAANYNAFATSLFATTRKAWYNKDSKPELIKKTFETLMAKLSPQVKLQQNTILALGGGRLSETTAKKYIDRFEETKTRSRSILKLTLALLKGNPTEQELKDLLDPIQKNDIKDSSLALALLQKVAEKHPKGTPNLLSKIEKIYLSKYSLKDDLENLEKMITKVPKLRDQIYSKIKFEKFDEEAERVLSEFIEKHPHLKELMLKKAPVAMRESFAEDLQVKAVLKTLENPSEANIKKAQALLEKLPQKALKDINNVWKLFQATFKHPKLQKLIFKKVESIKVENLRNLIALLGQISSKNEDIKITYLKKVDTKLITDPSKYYYRLLAPLAKKKNEKALRIAIEKLPDKSLKGLSIKHLVSEIPTQFLGLMLKKIHPSGWTAKGISGPDAWEINVYGQDQAAVATFNKYKRIGSRGTFHSWIDTASNLRKILREESAPKKDVEVIVKLWHKLKKEIAEKQRIIAKKIPAEKLMDTKFIVGLFTSKSLTHEDKTLIEEVLKRLKHAPNQTKITDEKRVLTLSSKVNGFGNPKYTEVITAMIGDNLIVKDLRKLNIALLRSSSDRDFQVALLSKLKPNSLSLKVRDRDLTSIVLVGTAGQSAKVFRVFLKAIKKGKDETDLSKLYQLMGLIHSRRISKEVEVMLADFFSLKPENIKHVLEAFETFRGNEAAKLKIVENFQKDLRAFLLTQDPQLFSEKKDLSKRTIKHVQMKASLDEVKDRLLIVEDKTGELKKLIQILKTQKRYKLFEKKDKKIVVNLKALKAFEGDIIYLQKLITNLPKQVDNDSTKEVIKNQLKKLRAAFKVQLIKMKLIAPNQAAHFRKELINVLSPATLNLLFANIAKGIDENPEIVDIFFDKLARKAKGSTKILDYYLKTGSDISKIVSLAIRYGKIREILPKKERTLEELTSKILDHLFNSKEGTKRQHFDEAFIALDIILSEKFNPSERGKPVKSLNKALYEKYKNLSKTSKNSGSKRDLKTLSYLIFKLYYDRGSQLLRDAKGDEKELMRIVRDFEYTHLYEQEVPFEKIVSGQYDREKNEMIQDSELFRTMNNFVESKNFERAGIILKGMGYTEMKVPNFFAKQKGSIRAFFKMENGKRVEYFVRSTGEGMEAGLFKKVDTFFDTSVEVSLHLALNTKKLDKISPPHQGSIKIINYLMPHYLNVALSRWKRKWSDIEKVIYEEIEKDLKPTKKGTGIETSRIGQILTKIYPPEEVKAQLTVLKGGHYKTYVFPHIAALLSNLGI